MPLSRQEAFDKAYKGIAAQGWLQSISETGACKYRSEDGKKCAVGHCIPNELYDEAMDHGASDVESLFNRFEIVKSVLNERDEEFYQSLQRSHDISFSPDDMKSNLAKFAEDFDLTIPEI